MIELLRGMGPATLSVCLCQQNLSSRRKGSSNQCMWGIWKQRRWGYSYWGKKAHVKSHRSQSCSNGQGVETPFTVLRFHQKVCQHSVTEILYTHFFVRLTPDCSPCIFSFNFLFVSHGHSVVSTESSRTGSASVNLKPLENRTDILTVRSSIREYRNKMEEKAKGQNHAAYRHVACRHVMSSVFYVLNIVARHIYYNFLHITVSPFLFIPCKLLKHR